MKNLPGSEPDVTYAYDNLGRLTGASQTGHALSFTYDALSRNLTQAGPQGTVASQWDVAGRRTRLTYPGSGLYVDYDYLVTGEMTKVRENGATSGIGVLATYAYDNLGRRSSLTRGNGTITGYSFDPVSRLATLTEDMASTGNDQSVTFTYNPASQITSLTKTNDAYAWTGHGNGSTASVANGLNQLTSIGGTATTHDSKGNVTFDPMSGKTYAYSSENLPTSSSGGTSATLAYDPAMRLYQVAAGATTRFAYDGLNLIAEYDGSNALQHRYVFGPAVDEPLVQYDGSGTTNRSWMHADERGSVIAISEGTGAVTTINKYDEYGKPQATNLGRFQYTGQVWLAEIDGYYYKARIYSPVFAGRFLQTDPIGTEGGINFYAYVGNDPVNFIDPLGLRWERRPWRTCTENGCTDNYNNVWVEDGSEMFGPEWDINYITASIVDGISDTGEAIIDDVVKSITDLICGIGNIGGGVGGDAYPAGGGGSLSGRVTIDPARGRIAIGGTGGVGPGYGAGAGAFITRSSPYSLNAGVLQVSTGACLTGAYVVGVTHCETYAGSDGNTGRSTTLSLVKAGVWFNPASPDIALVAPSLWNIGCKD